MRLGCEYIQLDAPHYPLLADSAYRDFYASRGGYDWLAQRLFPRVRAERLLMEYDDDRSGGFDALAAVPQDKTVVLGLVTTKTGRQETVEELETRIREAACHVPLERLALSPQCGFATSILGNALSPADQEANSRQSLRPPSASGVDGRSLVPPQGQPRPTRVTSHPRPRSTRPGPGNPRVPQSGRARC